MSRRLTKDQLIARIAEVEAQCGLRDQSLLDLQRALDESERSCVVLRQELNALYCEQRPSRGHSRSHDFAPTEQPLPVVYIRGVACTKRTAWEHGRRVTTYTPVDEASIAQREHAEHHYGERH